MGIYFVVNNKIRWLVLSMLLFLGASQSVLASSIDAKQADAKQADILKFIDKDANNARLLLKKVVNINSGTMNFRGVKQVGQVFRQAFDQLGFKTQWVDGKDFNRAGHLVASYGDAGPRLLLIGHLDTVFAVDSDFQTYEVLSDDRVRGPGITDMKGGDVIIVSVLKALRHAGVLQRMSIRVVMTGDEEKRGRPLAVANKALLEAAKWADIAIGFEDGDGDPKTAVVSRRGASGWTLQVSAKSAHSSQIFRQDIGDGAIFAAAHILEKFRQALSREPNLTFNPGLIVGGTQAQVDRPMARGSAFGKSNVIAKTAVITGDIRALSPQQLTKAQQKMQQIVNQTLPYTQAEISFAAGYPPMAPSKGNLSLLALYSDISQELGFGSVEAVDPRRAGAADISFSAPYVDKAIDGLGLMGVGGHTVNEIADMTTLTQQTKRAALLIYRLTM